MNSHLPLPLPYKRFQAHAYQTAVYRRIPSSYFLLLFFFQLARVARRPWFSSCWQSQSEERRVTLSCFVSFSSHHLSQISSQSSPVCRARCCRQLCVRSLSLCAL